MSGTALRLTWLICAAVTLAYGVLPRSLWAGDKAAGGPQAAREGTALTQSDASTRDDVGVSGFIPRFVFRRPGTYIQSGQRIESSEGRVRVSRLSFGSGGDPMGREIPSHLGGGVLFLQPIASGGASVTALYRGEDWTGSLTPVASVPFVVEQVEFGFDRLYLLGTGIQIGFDLQERRVLPLDPLPPLVTISGLRFASETRALVAGPLAGVLLTEDAGMTWTPLPEARNVQTPADEPGLFVRTRSGFQEVGPGGVLGEPAIRVQAIQEASTDEQVWRGGADALMRELDYLLAQGTAAGGDIVALSGARLLTLSTRPALGIRSRSVLPDGTRTCQASQYSSRSADAPTSLLFVCTQGRELEVFSLPEGSVKSQRGSPSSRKPLSPSPPVRLKLELSARKRELLYHADGAALLSGDCQHGRPGFACAVSPGRVLTVPYSKPLAGEEAVALNGRELVRVQLNRRERSIVVRRWTGHGEARHLYRFAADSREGELASGGGTLLPQAGIVEGQISVWLVQGEKFVGLRLGDGAEVDAGAIQRPLARAVFAGTRALVWGAAGFAKQSVDGGLTFTEIHVPFRSGDPELSAIAAPWSAVKMGCSSAGCVLGSYVRLGWQTDEETTLPLPEPVRLIHPGGGKLHFTCGRGSYQGVMRVASESKALPPFWESRPPVTGLEADAFSIGIESGAARLYGWGPSDRPWGREGWLSLQFVDPWRPARIMKSEATPRLFASAAEAREQLGLIERHTMTTELELDPAGDGGVALVRSRQDVHLFVFQKGQPLERYALPTTGNYRNLSGAVYSSGSWYLGFGMGREFSVFRLEPSGPVSIASFPLGTQSPRDVRLVRSTSSDLGIMMEGDRGLVVYPLSHIGDLGSAILVPHSAKRPPACPAEAGGFIVDRNLSLAPHLERPDGTALDVSSLRARFIVGYGEPCLEAMSARTRDELPQTRLSIGPNAVPLALLNHDSLGTRAELLCD